MYILGHLMTPSTAVLTNERTLFLRERAAGYYTTFPFFVTKLVGDLVPLRVLPAICFGSIMVGTSNIHTGAELLSVLHGCVSAPFCEVWHIFGCSRACEHDGM